MANTKRHKCDGRCENHGGHSGDIQQCRVSDPSRDKDWGLYHYCQTAQSIDKKGGFTVEVQEQQKET